MRKAEGKATVDYGFHMALRGLGDTTLADVARLTRNEGVTSFKLYLAYPGVLQVDDGTFFRRYSRHGSAGRSRSSTPRTVASSRSSSSGPWLGAKPRYATTP